MASRIVTLAAAFAIGCGNGGDDGEPTGTVHGTALFQGRPIPADSFVVLMHSEKGLTATGRVDDEGHFRITSPEGEHIPVGEYAVAVTPPEGEARSNDEAMALLSSGTPIEDPHTQIPAKHRNPATSGVTFTVAAGENTLNLELSE